MIGRKLLLNTLRYQLEPSMFSLSDIAVEYWNGYFRALTYKNTPNLTLCAAELDALLFSSRTPMAELMLEYLTIEEKVEAEESRLRELSNGNEEKTSVLDDLNMELEDVKDRIEIAEKEYPRDLDVEEFLLVGLGYKDASEVDPDELDYHNLNFLRTCCEVVGETGLEEGGDVSEGESEANMEVDDKMKMITAGVEGYVADWNEQCLPLVGCKKY
ncbi:hypothetical protein B7494_g8355 [Chlorociboria aeruginascens]|nr:hypothetical protein B7494_g8355 [Chlorociboria aeruginascens]